MNTRERDRLCFAESVRRHFDFLEGHRLAVVAHTLTYVRYESARLFVNVYHGRRSFEIGLEIGRLSQDDQQPYPMSAIVAVMEPSVSSSHLDYAARTAADVDEGVRRLAAPFRAFVGRGLLEDPGLFSRLERDRQGRKLRMAQDVDLSHARLAAEDLWRAKDYAGVIRLLAPLRESLEPSELKKLEFAEKHRSD